MSNRRSAEGSSKEKCPLKKYSFSRSPGYSISTVKFFRSNRNKGMHQRVWVQSRSATNLSRLRVWRFSNWKNPRGTIRTTTLQIRARRSGDADSPAVAGRFGLDKAASFLGNQGVSIKIIVRAHGRYAAASNEVISQP